MRRTAPARSKHALGASGSAAAASGTLRARRHCSPLKTCRSRRGTGRSGGFAYNGISDRVVPLHRIALLQIPLESRLRRTIAASSPSSGPARHPISPGLLLFRRRSWLIGDAAVAEFGCCCADTRNDMPSESPPHDAFRAVIYEERAGSRKCVRRRHASLARSPVPWRLRRGEYASPPEQAIIANAPEKGMPRVG